MQKWLSRHKDGRHFIIRGGKAHLPPKKFVPIRAGYPGMYSRRPKMAATPKIIGKVRIRGWHVSPTGKFRMTSAGAATEGEGYYFFLDKRDAVSFADGDKIIPVRVSMNKPLDAIDESPYILNESGKIFKPQKPTDPPYLSAIKEAVKRSGTTEKNWGSVEQSTKLHKTITKVLQEQGNDGLLIQSWGVKFPKKMPLESWERRSVIKR